MNVEVPRDNKSREWKPLIQGAPVKYRYNLGRVLKNVH
jgi:hypothetical protein